MTASAVVPLKAGRGKERWMNLEGLAEQCRSASASTRLFAADNSLSSQCLFSISGRGGQGHHAGVFPCAFQDGDVEQR